jgi:uncharacterized protein (TIGR00730 family)
LPAVTVFCGSAVGLDPRFVAFAEQVGSLLAALKIDLVYGGSKDGCMGAAANGCLAGGGKVTGVLPDFFLDWEILHPSLTETIFTQGMAQRKELLIEKGEVILILPGGFGTLDEFFEVLTLTSLKRIKPKAVVIVDPFGFYDGLVNWLETVQLAGFTREGSHHFSVVRELSVLKSFLSGPQNVS